MKHAVLFILLISLPAVLAQQPTPKKTPRSKTQSKVTTARKAPSVAATRPTPSPLSEKEQFQKASGLELAADRVAALESFLTAFPQSEDRTAAIDLLASSRILIAEEKILSGNTADAVALFRLVVEQLPQPVPNELFVESIAKIPSTLFFRGQRTAAIELAGMIESKVESNAAQLIEIANFHLSTENGAEAMRVAAKAAAKDPSSAAVQRTIALAHRINFDLDLSADAYAKSLELDPESLASKRGLAEMKRALGKSDEAVTLYRDLLAKNENDLPSRTGLVLALFDSGKRSEAEDELTKALGQTPGNVILMAGAAYWYASKGIGDKAVELAEKAVAREPRYIWSHIALARGLISQRKPVEAEQVLIKARAYGNFPTLEYELASARMAAGFFREAAEDIQKHFSVTSSGTIKTNLGGRVVREEKSLSDLASFERKASIFAPVGADNPETAEALKNLLILEQKLQAPQPNETEVAAAADAFTSGSDKMRLHRQLHAASLLLQKRVALAKVLELTKAATGNTDDGLAVPSPRAAVLASELYEPRAAAFRTNDFLVVPEVPTQTLSAILRGRIEEIAGWALYQQNNFPDAVIRLRRAISVMPDKSAWWRSSMWRLGAALAADGKDAEALNFYIESYKTDKPDMAKYAVVEALYRKVNGSIEGLEAKIGSDRVATSSAIQEIKPAATPTVAAETPVVSTTEAAPAAAVSPVPIVAAPVTEPAKALPEKTDERPTPDAPTSAKPATPTEVPVEKKDPPPTDQDSKPVAKTEPVVTTPENSKPVAETKPPEVKIEPALEAKTPEVKTKPASETKPPETKTPEVKTEPSSETKTPETKSPEVKTEPPVQTEPPATKTESPAESKPPEEKTESSVGEVKKTPAAPAEKPQRAAERPAATEPKMAATKPLFEPIIITIPNRRPAKSDTTRTEKKEPSDESRTESDASGSARPRVIDGQEVRTGDIEPCIVGASQENLSVINNGGSVGILVNVEAPGEIKDLTATSSSPKDVEVILQPEIGGVADRRFFVIKSVSTSLGLYQITFSTPCGKQVVSVTVR